MRISLLHTIDGNRRVFDAAAEQLGLPAEDIRHEVRADLREAVQQAGAFSAELKARTTHCLLALAAESDAVIVTCATLGPAAEEIEQSVVPIVRADRALAAAAVKSGGKVAVLCAVESAIEPNRQLFEEHAGGSGASIEIAHVAAVWELYQRGDMAGCHAAVASAADKAYETGATVVAFAHPWMAPAVSLVRDERRPMHSAEMALRAVTRMSS